MKNIFLCVSLLMFWTNSIRADQPLLGLPVNGIKATISIEKDISAFKDIQGEGIFDKYQ